MAGDDTGKLAGKVALIAGAGSRIGEAMALLFSREGARVIAADIDGEAARRTARQIGEAAISVQVDVADWGGVQRMAATSLERFGRVDILCNNAGIGSSKELIDTEPEEWDRLFAVNVRGVFLCCKAILPGMIERGGGVVVNTASVAGLVGLPKRAAYCASKGAIVTLTKQIAVEYVDRGVRCNCVCPGTIDTPWVGRLLDEADEPVAARAALIARQPMGRLGQAEEIARAALYLASDDTAFMTGSSLVIDGGLLAR